MKPSRDKSANRRRVATLVAAERMEAIRLSDAIADLAEPGFKEDESSRLLSQYLSARGFAVEFPWKPMPTAFKATWGRGKPSIGLLAEYDALPNCGPRESDYGHGCGHNLLGVGAAVGAVAAAGMLRQAGLDGQIVLWGCPAEELVAGKVYMARDGAFRCNDDGMRFPMLISQPQRFCQFLDVGFTFRHSDRLCAPCQSGHKRNITAIPSHHFNDKGTLVRRSSNF